MKSMSEFNSLYFHGCKQWKQSQKIGSEDAIRFHRGLIIYVSRLVKESNHSLIGKINLVDLAGNSILSRILIFLCYLRYKFRKQC